MALDENQNEIFDRNEQILDGHIVWIGKNIHSHIIDVPALVERIRNGSENPIRVIDLHSSEFKAVNCQIDQLKRLHANDERFDNVDNGFLIDNTNNLVVAATNTAFRLWNSAINIVKLLLKIRPKDRTKFLLKVLKPILQIKERLEFDRKFRELMKRRDRYSRFVGDDRIINELTAVYQSELAFERELNNVNHQHNHHPEEIVLRPNRVCSNCLGTENVTECCTHCHRYFDEACFADIRRENDDPENLCPDCEADDAVMEPIAPSCAICDANLQVDANNLYKCIFHECSVSYHAECVPAGAQKLSKIQMICTEHNDPNSNSDKLTICEHCCESGRSLIKCNFCPLAFHSRKCLKLSSTKNTEVICEICKEGRILSNGDAIYAWNGSRKKWWPAIIVPEKNVPERELESRTMPERDRSGYFWIRFLQMTEFKWIHQSNVLIRQQINVHLEAAIRGTRRSKLYVSALAEMDERFDN